MSNHKNIDLKNRFRIPEILATSQKCMRCGCNLLGVVQWRRGARLAMLIVSKRERSRQLKMHIEL